MWDSQRFCVEFHRATLIGKLALLVDRSAHIGREIATAFLESQRKFTAVRTERRSAADQAVAVTAECGRSGITFAAGFVVVEWSNSIITLTTRWCCNFALLRDDGGARSMGVEDVEFDELIRASSLAAVPIV
jgi:hypothetical protein